MKVYKSVDHIATSKCPNLLAASIALLEYDKGASVTVSTIVEAALFPPIEDCHMTVHAGVIQCPLVIPLETAIFPPIENRDLSECTGIVHGAVGPFQRQQSAPFPPIEYVDVTF